MNMNGTTAMGAIRTLKVLTNRRWLAAIGGVVLVVVISQRCGRDEAPIAAAVAAHDVVDRALEAKIQEEKQIAEAGRKAESAAVVRKNKAIAVLSTHGGNVVLSAKSARWSSAPTEEMPVVGAGTLFNQILAASDSELSAANVQIAALTTALDLSETRATASDSVLHVVAKDKTERCRVLGVVRCPSRVVAIALTGAAVLALLRR